MDMSKLTPDQYTIRSPWRGVGIHGTLALGEIHQVRTKILLISEYSSH